jgi:hypothetical protein
VFDTIQSIVGELSDLHGHAHLQRPTVNLLDPKSQTITGTTTSNVPDLLLATGRLSASPTTQPNALVSIRVRTGPPFPGEPPLVLYIYGEKGEIKLTVEGGMSIAIPSGKPVAIEVHDFASDSVEKVQWEWEEWQTELPDRAKNIGALYEAYAKGEGYPTFEDAERRHGQIDRLLERFTA